MTIPADVMRRLIALDQAAQDAARRRDEAVQLVLAMAEAAPDAQIVLRADGCGEVVASKSPPVGSDTAG